VAPDRRRSPPGRAAPTIRPSAGWRQRRRVGKRAGGPRQAARPGRTSTDAARRRPTQESPGRSNRSRGFKPLAGVRSSFGGATRRSALSHSLVTVAARPAARAAPGPGLQLRPVTSQPARRAEVSGELPSKTVVFRRRRRWPLGRETIAVLGPKDTPGPGGRSRVFCCLVTYWAAPTYASSTPPSAIPPHRRGRIPLARRQMRLCNTFNPQFSPGFPTGTHIFRRPFHARVWKSRCRDTGHGTRDTTGGHGTRDTPDGHVLIRPRAGRRPPRVRPRCISAHWHRSAEAMARSATARVAKRTADRPPLGDCAISHNGTAVRGRASRPGCTFR
jgi:hypothetical protein